MPASHAFQRSLYNGQSQPCTRDVSDIFSPVEGFVQVLQVLLRNADPMVIDRDLDLARTVGEAHRNLAVFW